MPRSFHKAAGLFGLVAAVFLVAMMLLTTIDVVFREVFSITIVGTFEIVTLFLIAMVFLAFPAVILRDDNVVVDILDAVTVAGTRRFLWLFGLVLTFAFLAVLAYKLIEPITDSIAFNDVTSSLALPKYIFRIPMLVGIASAAIAACFVIAWGILHKSDGGARP